MARPLILEKFKNFIRASKIFCLCNYICLDTICYWAPERLDPEHSGGDERSNVWSLGIVLIETIQAKNPILRKIDKKKINDFLAVQNSIKNFKFKVNEELTTSSLPLQSFIEGCIKSFDERVNYDSIKKTKFYEEYKDRVSENVMNLVNECLNSAEDHIAEIELPQETEISQLALFEKENHRFSFEAISEDDAPIYAHRKTIIKGGVYGIIPHRVAVKTFQIYKSSEPVAKLERINNEIEVYRRLYNVTVKEWSKINITTLIAYREKLREVKFCIELMDCNLLEVYTFFHQAKQIPFPEDLWRCILSSIISALEHCHKLMIIHCDIKPTNILFNQSGRIKLTNFGHAIDLNNPLSYIGGTPAYWTPEIFVDTKARLNPKRDIWSLGITLAESLLGHLPYLEKENEKPNGLNVLEFINTMEIPLIKHADVSQERI